MLAASWRIDGGEHVAVGDQVAAIHDRREKPGSRYRRRRRPHRPWGAVRASRGHSAARSLGAALADPQRRTHLARPPPLHGVDGPVLGLRTATSSRYANSCPIAANCSATARFSARERRAEAIQAARPTRVSSTGSTARSARRIRAANSGSRHWGARRSGSRPIDSNICSIVPRSTDRVDSSEMRRERVLHCLTENARVRPVDGVDVGASAEQSPRRPRPATSWRASAAKSRILDELCANTGWHRNHARKALNAGAAAHDW